MMTSTTTLACHARVAADDVSSCVPGVPFKMGAGCDGAVREQATHPSDHQLSLAGSWNGAAKAACLSAFSLIDDGLKGMANRDVQMS